MTKNQTETNASRHFFREIEIQFLIHEMKDPVAIAETGVRTLLERQDKFGALSVQQERTLKRTLRNVVKAREMLNGLLEVGRSEAGICCADRFDPAPVILQVILDALETHLTPDADAAAFMNRPDELQQVLEKNGIHLEMSPTVRRTRMCQDETRFRQIVGNLFKNALYHRKQRIDVRADTDGDFLVVSVTDDGAGIDPKHHELVFRQYVQVTDTARDLPRKGHGLGLAGALIMARSINGTLHLKSEKGQGATFSLRLPITLNPDSPEDAG